MLVNSNYSAGREDEEASSTLMEVGDWICGVVMGEFNEDPEVSQIITDMAISFAPGIGELCDIRDIIAVLLRWYNDPRKMQDPLEWVTFAGCAIGLVPVVGWPLKTTARFIAHYGDDVVQMAAELIALLNRIGVGNAEKWLRETRFVDYHQQLLEKLTEFLNSFIDILRSCQKSLFSLVVGLREHLKDLADWLKKILNTIPIKIKETLHFFDKLKNKFIKGAKNKKEQFITSPNYDEVMRATEATPVTTTLKNTSKKRFIPIKNSIAQEIFPTLGKNFDIAEGDLLNFSTIPKETDIVSGKKLFRVYGNKKFNWRLMTVGKSPVVNKSKAGGRWWGFADEVPKTAKEWREKFAVLDSFNGNGKMVEITIDKGSIKGLAGTVAEQSLGCGRQYLPGGGEQVILESTITRKIDTAINEAINQGVSSGQITLKDGTVISFIQKETNWPDANGTHGWTQRIVSPMFRGSDFLSPEEERPKGEDFY